MDTHREEAQDLTRIQAFSDGVFAFAITLLAISFNVPNVPQSEVATELPKQLLGQIPQLVTYITSFTAIGAFWYSHHQKFNYIKRYDGLFVWLNLLILACIALLPFTTNLVGDYSSSTLAVNIYSGSIVLTGLTFVLLWWHATYKKRLVDKEMSKGEIKYGYITSASVCVVFLTSMLLTLVHIDLAQYAWFLVLLVPLLFRVQSRD